MILLSIVAGQPASLASSRSSSCSSIIAWKSCVAAYLRAAQSPRARTHFGRLPDCARPSRRRHSHHPRSASRAEAKENLLKYFTEQDVTITENGKSRKLEGVKLDGRKYSWVPWKENRPLAALLLPDSHPG